MEFSLAVAHIEAVVPVACITSDDVAVPELVQYKIVPLETPVVLMVYVTPLEALNVLFNVVELGVIEYVISDGDW